MNQPYYDAIDLQPVYSNEDLLEQVYDDRNLPDANEEEEWLDWEILESEVLE